MRNLAIAIFKLAGHPGIAAACRRHARDATRTLATLGISPGMSKRTPRDAGPGHRWDWPRIMALAATPA